MAYEPDHGTVEWAIRECVKLLSPREIQEAAGVNPNTLYAYANPNTGNHISFSQCARLDAALSKRNEAKLFAQIYEDEYNRAHDDNYVSARETKSEIAQCAEHVGRIAEKDRKASEDGYYSPDEHKDLAGGYGDLARHAIANRDYHLAMSKSETPTHLKAVNS